MADRRLQVFHTVARMMSFTKAAEMLQMTQPAVTFQVRQLEEQYNVRLFDRSHNRIDLTQAGKKAFDYAERIFDLYSEMENAIREVTGQVCGLLRVGASTNVAEFILPGLLARFQADFPAVQIQVTSNNSQAIISLVENSFVDIGLVEGKVDDKKLNATAFSQEEMVLVVPAKHEFAISHQAPIEKLAAQPWILREDGSSTRESILQYLQSVGLKQDDIKVAMELDSAQAIKASVEAGRGISILPRSMLTKELQLGSLAAISLTPKFSLPVHFIYKEQKFPLRVLDEFSKYAYKPELSLVSNDR
jgi:DNA-binding transcriptional LysR family regulator